MKRLAALALWGVFVLVLAFGGAEFLRACGVGGWNYCPAAPVADPRVVEFARSEELRRLIHMAELRLAEQPSCPPPEPALTFDRDAHPSAKRGAEEGRVEVFLRWFTRDDVDLVVDCPGGGEFGGQAGRPGSCGEGKVDVDANRKLTENVSDTPEEHAVWATEAPPGELRVEAFIFRAVHSNRRNVIPFEMTFKLGETSKTCNGEIQYFPASEHRRTSNGRTLASYSPYIPWTPSEGLPADCQWQTDESFYCRRGECDKR